jgi:non-specific protein-tyrosine kinase
MLVAGASAYFSASRETPLYSATATMMVSPGLSGTSADYNAVITSERLAGSYQQLVTTQPIRERVAETLGTDGIPAGYSASAVDGSQLIRVTASGTDPETVALVANTVVTEFVDYTNDQARARADVLLEEINSEIDLLEQRQQEIDSEIASLRDDDDASQRITDLQSERSAITQSLIDLTSERISTSTQTAAQSAQIQQVEQAEVPGAPFSPQPMRSLLLGLFVGALLGAGVVALLEFLDNTVKPEIDVQGIAGAPMLATVSNIAKLEPGGRQVYTMSQPQSGAAEALRLLRTNLEFASASEPIHALTVSSPSPGEGKSTTAANLGVVMAQSGLATVVIDADLRKPTQNRIFGVDNHTGLTTLLTHPDQAWEDVAKKVALPGLFLIPSGPIPPNPSDLLSSDRFAKLIERIKDDADLVIIDSPPALSASDALAISRYTDGVVLVVHSGKTRTDALRHAAHSIHQGGIRLIGVVLNRQKGQHGASYYGEYYGTNTTPANAPSVGD